MTASLPCAGQSKFQFDTSDLEPGKHTFALTAHDGYGNSVEQTYLFEVVGGEY